MRSINLNLTSWVGVNFFRAVWSQIATLITTAKLFY